MNVDRWMGVFLNDPFYLSPEQYWDRTSHELWEWYLKPAREREKRLKEDRDNQGAWIPDTDEEIEQAKMMLKAFLGGGGKK